MKTEMKLLAISVVSLALIATPAMAKLTPAQKCTAAKLRATAKKADRKAKCSVKTRLVAPPDPACLQKAEGAFVKAFTKAEKPGACTRTGDAASVEVVVDTFVAALVEALQPPTGAGTPAQKCAVAKLKAASKKALAKTKCQIKSLSLQHPAVSALLHDGRRQV